MTSIAMQKEPAMNTQRLDATTKSDHSATCFRRWTAACRRIELYAANFAIVLLSVLLLQTNFYGQNNEFFEIKSIIRDVKLRFELSPADLHRLGPLIQKENQEVLVIYSRFDGNEEGYPVDLWREVIRRRNDFESRINTGFKPREQAALRTARTALERRVLSYLVDDYINFLADVLELDNLQLEAVGKYLTRESSRKHLMIVKALSRPALLQAQLDIVAKETDRVMEIVLTHEQYRIYQTLSADPNGPVG
jgi:hypothetical protein